MKEKETEIRFLKKATQERLFLPFFFRSSQTKVTGGKRNERKKDTLERVCMMKERKNKTCAYYISFVLFLVKKDSLSKIFRLRIVCM
jgi:hypothetical protein